MEQVSFHAQEGGARLHREASILMQAHSESPCILAGLGLGLQNISRSIDIHILILI